MIGFFRKRFSFTGQYLTFEKSFISPIVGTVLKISKQYVIFWKQGLVFFTTSLIYRKPKVIKLYYGKTDHFHYSKHARYLWDTS